MADVLLEFGADISLQANGGSTITTLMGIHGGDKNFLGLIEKHGLTLSASGSQPSIPELGELISSCTGETNATVETLIPEDRDHPGAGSFIIDGAISDFQIGRLVDLFTLLPVDQTQKKKEGLTKQLRSPSAKMLDASALPSPSLSSKTTMVSEASWPGWICG